MSLCILIFEMCCSQVAGGAPRYIQLPVNTICTHDLAIVAIQICTVPMHYFVHASVPYSLSVVFGVVALDSLW